MADLQPASDTLVQPHKSNGHRLTAADRAFALRYHADGLTQTAIAQRLNCDQATVSRWLTQCADTTVEASAFFRGQALPMAEKIVKRGRPSDLIKALQGVGVLEQDRANGGLVIQIGVKDSDVSITLGPTQLAGDRAGETVSPRVQVAAPSPPLTLCNTSVTAERAGANVNITSLIGPTSGV